MPVRSEITLLLELPGTASLANANDGGKIDPDRRRALAEHRGRMFEEMAQHDRAIRRTREKSERETWLKEMAQTLEVDVEMLLPEETEETASQPDSPEDETDDEEDQASVSF